MAAAAPPIGVALKSSSALPKSPREGVPSMRTGARGKSVTRGKGGTVDAGG